MVVLRVDSNLPRPKPARICVEWRSGHIDLLDLPRPRGVRHDADLVELRQLVRDLSDGSLSVKRAWLEDDQGRLIFSAVRGLDQPRKEGPME